MKPKRKYVNTSGDCDHCKLGGRLYFCLLHIAGCGICEKCANLQIDDSKDHFKMLEEKYQALSRHIALLKKE